MLGTGRRGAIAQGAGGCKWKGLVGGEPRRGRDPPSDVERGGSGPSDAASRGAGRGERLGLAVFLRATVTTYEGAAWIRR
jgi:hypothetical protein